jgi:hypothetical protein
MSACDKKDKTLAKHTIQLGVRQPPSPVGVKGLRQPLLLDIFRHVVSQVARGERLATL